MREGMGMRRVGGEDLKPGRIGCERVYAERNNDDEDEDNRSGQCASVVIIDVNKHPNRKKKVHHIFKQKKKCVAEGIGKMYN